MSLFDDLINIPANLIGGLVGLSVTGIAATLLLPVAVVQKAIEAGCDSMEEIQDWADENL